MQHADDAWDRSQEDAHDALLSIQICIPLAAFAAARHFLSLRELLAAAESGLDTLDAIHARGGAHGKISVAHVGLTSDGAAVLVAPPDPTRRATREEQSQDVVDLTRALVVASTGLDDDEVALEPLVEDRLGARSVGCHVVDVLLRGLLPAVEGGYRSAASMREALLEAIWRDRGEPSTGVVPTLVSPGGGASRPAVTKPYTATLPSATR